MISNNNLKNILSNLFNKSKAETDKQYNQLTTEMNKGWISSGNANKITNGNEVNDTPVGSIIAHMGNSAPLNYLICDGSEYNIEDYKELSDFINTEFGSYNYFGGNGTTTFAVPDLRGEFLRGTGTNVHENQGSGANVGIHQDATVHRGIVTNSKNNGYTRIATQGIRTPNENGDITSINPDYEYQPGDWENALSISWDRTGGHARNFNSRPTNTSVLYCIKYESTKLLSISMYDGSHYSEEEEIVGKWINGKPLYRKVIPFLFPSVSGITNFTGVLPDEMEELVSCRGKSSGINQYDPSMAVFRDFPFWLTNTDWVTIYINYKTISLGVGSNVPEYNKTNKSCFIVEYTKTTDEPYTLYEDIAFTAHESEVDEIINRLGE